MAATEIRTYKSRHGRLRTRRRDALRRLLPRYGVPGNPAAPSGPSAALDPAALDPAALFGRRAPLVLEIGSGMGEHTAAMAAADPGRDYLAAEVHAPGAANLLLRLEEQGLTNLRVYHGDALALVRDRLPLASLAAIHVFFPDPWPKQRHHKRRLFQAATVARLRDRLVPGGVLHAATDATDYAQVIRDTLTSDPELVNPYSGWAPRTAHRPVTRYEQRALAAGHPIFEIVVRRTPPRRTPPRRSDP